MAPRAKTVSPCADVCEKLCGAGLLAMHAKEACAFAPPCAELAEVGHGEVTPFALKQAQDLWKVPHARRARVFQNPRRPRLRQSIQNLNHRLHDFVSILQSSKVVL